MNFAPVTLSGATLHALGDRALWWPDARALIVSDLHLGKSERMARRGGAMLPPYETRDTLDRLARLMDAHDPAIVVCVGDSFDDNAARAGLDPEAEALLAALQAGRDWVWIAGNHDPVPTGLAGIAVPEWRHGPITFRHIARPGGAGEISGHFHPKAHLPVRGKLVSRPCFLIDGARIVLPAFGTYTGGLDWMDPALQRLMAPGARAILTGPAPCAVPMPRRLSA